MTAGLEVVRAGKEEEVTAWRRGVTDINVTTCTTHRRVHKENLRSRLMPICRFEPSS
ncbi:hypothetical protein CHLRE_10g422876v5 [Chlamydomonas reinhardtii]|uniref:Uncharacterized protein n=1 Tax=Chlamydomonas reinhardtii TaxID=3055 RepID=A0A2K3D9B1_CHLRE|nr:uncharacterized protein CHLRE_10g422876v5 [Chlamydomonas reinhardtii]PNW77118.1 hypothetical protein CHLRE_10g422876v5 [Chlamydomonas reinhardtii]